MTTDTQKLKKLFITNPMKMEVARFKSRFFTCTESVAFNKALIGLALLSYALIVWLVFTARADVVGGVVVLVQAVLLLLLAPLIAHGLIAGERDRRSWDLLQVAPVTQEQIVVGKFMGALTAVVGVSVGFLPMVLIGYFFGPKSTLSGLLLAEGIAIASASAAIAFTMYLSCRLKSANATLAASIASLVGVLVIFPGALSVLLNSGTSMDVLMVWHPLWAIVRTFVETTNSSNFATWMNPLYGWPQIIGYLAVSLLFVRLSIGNLVSKAGKQ